MAAKTPRAEILVLSFLAPWPKDLTVWAAPHGGISGSGVEGGVTWWRTLWRHEAC